MPTASSRVKTAYTVWSVSLRLMHPGRRQTSFSAVEVVPDIPDTSTDFEIKPDDYEMQVYRSSGAGGQHINKTSSAVRLIHKATGIVVACQTERSQLQNKENCLRMLRSKLVEIKEREHLEKISDIKGVQQKIEWGSQIRSYVFMPYTLAKDTRTGFENANINAVRMAILTVLSTHTCLALATGVWEGSKGGNSNLPHLAYPPYPRLWAQGWTPRFPPL